MKLLHIDASILGTNSASRRVSAAAVDQLRREHPGLAVTYRDLAAQPLGHFTGEHFAANQGVAPQSPAMQADVAIAKSVLDEFLAADIVVIGAPMYNFTIPSQLKSWIDRILVAGKTFRYGANGAEGLAGNKRVIVAISRGGLYAPGAALEHLETYLRGVLGFIAITPEFIVAEGLAVGPEQREKAMQSALESAATLHAA